MAAHQQPSSPKSQKRFISAPIAELIQSYRVEEILIIGISLHREEQDMDKKKSIKWRPKPAGKDYDAAETFLQLLYKPKKARRWAKQLKQAKITEYTAKDILRASSTPMSEIQAFDWRKQQKEIDEGKALSPILIVKQNNGGRLIIADGFHRMCALFANDQEIKVLCKIV